MPPFSPKGNPVSIYDPDYIKGLFHSMSVSYERMNYIASFGFSARWRYQFLQKIEMKQPRIKILDLMTGMGESWAGIKDTFPGCDLTALDFCDGMIARAKKKSEKKYNNSIAVIREDILNSNISDNAFDAVVCSFGLKTFDEKQTGQLAKEVRRILKPGGQFTFIEISVPPNALLRAMYKLYLKHIIPAVGKLMLGNPREYRMLWEYTSRYLNSGKTTQIFCEAGLQTRSERYFFGCATGISGFKPA